MSMMEYCLWPVVPFYSSNIVQSKCSFSWNLDTKFCLHAVGGIFVEQSFTNSGGNLSISGSSAKEYGGAVLRSSSLGLWHDFEMAVGSGRSTLGSENRKNLKRRDTMICHQCLRHSLIANWCKSRCLSLFLPPIWVGSTEAVWDHLCYWVWFWSWHKM